MMSIAPPAGRTRTRPAVVFALASFVLGSPAHASSQSMDASAILQELRELQVTGTVLYVAAHPDDENSRLIAWLARERGYRTGYLSLTRGDGGQNLLGPELRESLGVIRTQELLAARRIDGGEQFFTRANDFGFSKSPDETLRIWDRQAVLCDIVRVIRTVRPDVIITRFSPLPANTHGHHTASAILAVEAFKLAGDPNAFPQELAGLVPWQPKRVLWNAFRWGPDALKPLPPGAFQIDVGGYNALLGASYSEIAARSRSMHKSQGFGSVGSRGTALEEFQVIAGAPATQDIMEGVDATWNRVTGAAGIGKQLAATIESYNPQHPSASVPALLAIRTMLDALAPEPMVITQQRRLDRVIAACLGLYVESVIPRADITPGVQLKIKHTVIVRADGVKIRWVSVRYPASKTTFAVGVDLALNHTETREDTQTLPANTPVSQPYWLREPGTPGTFRVDDPSLIGRAENPPAFPVEDVFEIDGQTLVVNDAPVQVIDDPVKGELRHPLEIVPPVSLAFGDNLALFKPGSTRTIDVELAANRASSGTARLETPPGWTATPATQPFTLDKRGDHVRVSFSVTAPDTSSTTALTASVEIDGVRSSHRQIQIHYDHIPPQILQPPAQVKALAFDLKIGAHTIGYFPGAGDLVAESLTRMGCTVTILSAADLTPEKLHAFDAVVLGVRAFNTRADLVPQLPALFAYAEAGGTVVVQYNTTAELKSRTFAPYPLEISHDRVTDENAAMTFLAPDHPAFNTPNKLGPADFTGWVQERGLYFPNKWDEHFTPLLGCNDPGESPLSGALLVARYGKGWYVYTGLSFFRELPEGVPGAYRLFANLVSLGK